MRLRKPWIPVLLVLSVLVSTGCVSVYKGERYHFDREESIPANEVADGITIPVFYGYGTGASKTEAEDDAVSDAIQRSVFLALGDHGLMYRQQIEQLFDTQVDVRDYILSSAVNVIDWDYDRGTFSMIVSARLLLPEISDLLRREGIHGGLIQDTVSLRLPDQEVLDYQKGTALSEVLGPVGIPWGNGREPIFLVYYDESQFSDPFTVRTAVLLANDYLSSTGFSYVDMKQIESIKRDQDYVFTEETGENSMLRWIASKSHADYYIDVAVNTSSYSRGGAFYADASVTLSCFDASTAAGRGSVFIQTEKLVEGNTRSSAIDRAVADGITNGMYRILSKVSKYFTADAERGNSYELIILKTYDDRTMRAFQNVLADQVSTLVRTTFSVEETRYAITFSGTVDELADRIYETAEQYPELQDIYLIYQRGNVLTFNTGI